jgi:hypothetical protein
LLALTALLSWSQRSITSWHSRDCGVLSCCAFFPPLHQMRHERSLHFAFSSRSCWENLRRLGGWCRKWCLDATLRCRSMVIFSAKRCRHGAIASCLCGSRPPCHKYEFRIRHLGVLLHTRISSVPRYRVISRQT